MLVPWWGIAAVAVALVLAVAWSIVAAFAWWGLAIEIEEARAEGRRLRIDIYDQRARSDARAFGDRPAIAAEREGRELGAFQP